MESEKKPVNLKIVGRKAGLATPAKEDTPIGVGPNEFPPDASFASPEELLRANTVAQPEKLYVEEPPNFRTKVAGNTYFDRPEYEEAAMAAPVATAIAKATETTIKEKKKREPTIIQKYKVLYGLTTQKATELYNKNLEEFMLDKGIRNLSHGKDQFAKQYLVNESETFTAPISKLPPAHRRPKAPVSESESEVDTQKVFQYVK